LDAADGFVVNVIQQVLAFEQSGIVFEKGSDIGSADDQTVSLTVVRTGLKRTGFETSHYPGSLREPINTFVH